MLPESASWPMLPSWPTLPEIFKLATNLTHACYLRSACWPMPPSWPMLLEICKLNLATWDLQVSQCYMRTETWPKLPDICYLTPTIWDLPVDPCNLRSTRWLMLPEKLTLATCDQQTDSCYLRSWPMHHEISKQTHATWDVDPSYLRSASLTQARWDQQADSCYLRSWPMLPEICKLTHALSSQDKAVAILTLLGSRQLCKKQQLLIYNSAAEIIITVQES